MPSKDNPWLPVPPDAVVSCPERPHEFASDLFAAKVGEILGVSILSEGGGSPEKATAESFARMVREMTATLAVDDFELLEITIARKK